VLADEQRGCARECDNLSTKQTEFSITNHRDAIALRDRRAFENSTRRGEWFSEDCLLVGNILRNRNQIHVRQLQKLGVRAVATDDS